MKHAELLIDTHCELGEGALWHPAERKLYWVDIIRGRLFRYDPATHACERLYAGPMIGGFTFEAEGVLMFMEENRVRLLSNGQVLDVPIAVPGRFDMRFNDVIADPVGRVFAGTMGIPGRPRAQRGWGRLVFRARRKLARLRGLSMRDVPPPRGTLYRIDPPHQAATEIIPSIGVPNGMGFSPDHAHMYVTDSAQRAIFVFDYDKETGGVANRRLFARVAESDGRPDGLTVDAEGCVWSARWDGGCVVRYARDGSETLRVQVPARKVTSLTFGGPELTDIYISTAGGHRRESEGHGAGAIFHIDLGIHGLAEAFSRLKSSDLD